MSGFLTELRLEKIGTRLWKQTDILIYYSERYKGYLMSPEGTETDLGSIPRIAWMLFPLIDDYDPATVIHDAGYHNKLQTIMGRRVFTTKEVIDNIFLEAMISLGVDKDKAKIMYDMVKRFGKPNGQVIHIPNVVVTPSISGHNLSLNRTILLC